MLYPKLLYLRILQLGSRGKVQQFISGLWYSKPKSGYCAAQRGYSCDGQQDGVGKCCAYQRFKGND